MDDAPFILGLLNDPDFLRYIGDRGVRTLDDAAAYITNGPLASYARHGFGLYLVSLGDTGVPIGISGVLRRDTLPDPDIGFAFLPGFRRQGYALEAARAVLVTRCATSAWAASWPSYLPTTKRHGGCSAYWASAARAGSGWGRAPTRWICSGLRRSDGGAAAV